MSTPRRTAVSYSRFSHPKQAAGDSESRQERDYKTFCEFHNLTPGKEVFVDRGRSGYHGDHRKKGRLGELIDAAKSGRFDAGTVVVIEAWDRLGRLRPDRQTELVAELLRTGVCIGVCQLNDIFCEEDFGTHKWTTLAVFIQLAFQESKQKAKRVGDAWEARRKRAREEGELLGGNLPPWVEVVNDSFRLIPDRAATLRKMFQWCADGLSVKRIIRKLTQEEVPPFGEKIVREGRSRSQFAGVWTKPYVSNLLRDRRVLGELQLLKGGKPDGAPLVGYYPAAVEPDLFALARAAQEKRDTMKPHRGTRESRYVNLFKGLLTHARDGEGIRLENKGTSKEPALLLVNATVIEGRGDEFYSIPYYGFEECVLRLLREVDPASVIPDTDKAPSSATVLRAELKNCRDDIAKYKEELRAGFSKTLVELLREAEEREVKLADDLQDELARTAKPLAKSWDELPSLIDYIKDSPDPDAARLKLRGALRAVVENGVLLIVKKGSRRYAVLQMSFTGGARRDWLVSYRPACHHREASWEALSFASAGLPTISLTKPRDVEKIEKLLRSLD
jgi:DNA invertase Pin-like site-specific DNA recombinase